MRNEPPIFRTSQVNSSELNQKSVLKTDLKSFYFAQHKLISCKKWNFISLLILAILKSVYLYAMW